MLFWRSGFTLLEILVTILLMGLVSSVAMYSMRLPNQADALHEECSKYGRLFTFLSEQSMVESMLIGLYVDQNGFKILHRSLEQSKKSSSSENLSAMLVSLYDDYEKHEWVSLQLPEVKSDYKFLKDVSVSLKVGGISYQNDELGEDNKTLSEKSLDNKSNQKDIQPQIFFYPSMEVTPFEMIFKGNNNQEYILKIQENGLVTLNTSENDPDPEIF